MLRKVNKSLIAFACNANSHHFYFYFSQQCFCTDLKNGLLPMFQRLILRMCVTSTGLISFDIGK